jgi:hypothetical protein
MDFRPNSQFQIFILNPIEWGGKAIVESQGCSTAFKSMKIRGALAVGLLIVILQHLAPEIWKSFSGTTVTLFDTFSKVLKSTDIAAFSSLSAPSVEIR